MNVMRTASSCSGARSTPRVAASAAIPRQLSRARDCAARGSEIAVSGTADFATLFGRTISPDVSCAAHAIAPLRTRAYRRQS